MSRLSFSLAPLIEFLDDDLDAVASMPGSAVQAASAAEGVDRPALVARVRTRIVTAHRAEVVRTELRGKLESFGIDPLTELRGADLQALRLAGERLARADLRGADFTASDLSRADLANADLRNAQFVRASLVAANLSGARLDAANLAGADLSDARIAGACFVGATLDNAEGVPEPVRRGARISLEVAGLLQRLCRLDKNAATLPARGGDNALGRAGRLILLGEWDQASSILGAAADQRTALVKALLEMLKGDVDIAGRILAEVKSRIRD
jgi:hypothetical protein